jgi:hypothetical protein
MLHHMIQLSKLTYLASTVETLDGMSRNLQFVMTVLGKSDTVVIFLGMTNGVALRECGSLQQRRTVSFTMRFRAAIAWSFGGK